MFSENNIIDDNITFISNREVELKGDCSIQYNGGKKKLKGIGIKQEKILKNIEVPKELINKMHLGMELSETEGLLLQSFGFEYCLGNINRKAHIRKYTGKTVRRTLALDRANKVRLS